MGVGGWLRVPGKSHKIHCWGQILRDRSSPDDFTDHVVGGENRAMILRGRCV